MEMKKLDTLGRVPGQNKMPYLSPKNKGQQVLEVTYGHIDKGPRYTYVGNTHRTGDIVTPFVTHPKSGKTYRTLAVVRATHALQNGQGQLDKLAVNGIPVKRIGATHQNWLPGYKEQKEQNPSFTAKEWAQEAYKKYEDRTMQKVNQYGKPIGPIGGNK